MRPHRALRAVPLALVAAATLAVLPSAPGGTVTGPVAGAATPTVTTTPPCDATCRTLVSQGQGLVAAPGGPPGAIVLVDRSGVTAVSSFGTAEVGTTTAIGPDTHLRLASVSKMYSGAVALALVARGELHLSDPVGRWVHGLPDAWRPVTLAELLRHTSGLPDFIRSKDFATEVTAHPYDPPSRFGLVQLAFGEQVSPPGKAYHYSNTDNELVALVVQGVAHHSYEHELAGLVTGPLGLGQTTLPQTEDLPTPSAHGYQVAPGAAPEDVTDAFSAGWSWASGGIVATPSDTDRFVRAYVSGVLTTPAVRARQFTFRAGSSEPPGPGTNAAGMAVFRYTTPCGTVYGHTGNTLGFTQFAAASADGTRSVVVQVNGQVVPGGATAQAFTLLRELEGTAVCAALAP